jgi:glycosyltransferase involved in cell wall biosynthesis
MRILYIAADAVPSPKGAGVRIARTLRCLSDLGHSVRALTIAGADGAALSGIDHETIPLPAGNFLERALTFRRVTASWLADQQADVVQFRSIWEGIPAVAWAQRAHARVVFEAHGFPSIELPYHHPALFEAPQLLEKLLDEEAAVLRVSDLVLTHSQTGARYLRMRGVPHARVHVVPNTVDLELFSPTAPTAPQLPLRVAYVGTLAPWQGLPLLLEALTRFRGQAQIELHTVGPLKAAWRRQLRALARQLRVHHMLHLSGATTQQNLAPVLRNAHICVAPMPDDARNSQQGCCPIKVLEYMATGRPILATRIPPLLELLQHERNAWLVQPGSPAALAAGLRWLMEHPEQREALGARARTDVVARFSPSQFAARIGSALDQLEAGGLVQRAAPFPFAQKRDSIESNQRSGGAL